VCGCVCECMCVCVCVGVGVCVFVVFRHVSSEPFPPDILNQFI